MEIYFIIASIIEIFNRWDAKVFVSKSGHFFFGFSRNDLSDLFSLRNGFEIIRVVPVSSGRVIMSGLGVLILLFFRLRLLSAFFLFNLDLLSLEVFLESHCWSRESFWCFLQIFLILEVSIAYELLFGYLYNFVFVHASGMECLWAAYTLEYWHCIPTYAADVAVMERTPKMQRVCVNVLEELLNIVILDAFRVEIFSTISSRAFCNLILSFRSFNIFNLLHLLFTFSFFAFFVLSSIIKSFTLTDKACNKVAGAIRASPVGINYVFQILCI